MTIQISYHFIQSISPPIDWCDILWGYERQLIGWSDVVYFARARVADQDDNDVIELSGIDKEATFRVGELLRALAARDGACDEDKSQKIWLKQVLRWLFEHRSSYADPLGEVESVYADFDYPIEIEGFVRYMPVKDGYDPSAYSAQENEQRLYMKWEEYLKS